MITTIPITTVTVTIKVTTVIIITIMMIKLRVFNFAADQGAPQAGDVRHQHGSQGAPDQLYSGGE
jgi:hypothetical protein